MKSMLKIMTVLGFIVGLASFGHAGTPQENGQVPFQTAPLSGATILTSTASLVPSATLTLTVSTPTVINSGGGSFTGRNCLTKFIVQMSTYSTLTVSDNATVVWTLYGIGLGTTGVNTLTLPEDHLGPFCTANGDKTVFTLTPGASTIPGQSESINVEGYTTYGGTLNTGPMY